MAGIFLRPFEQVAIRHAVNETDGQRLLRPDEAAGHGDIERVAEADQPWQALRAAIAGHRAELDLRQAKPRLGRGHAKGAGERKLHAAAERQAVDRGE